MAKTETLNDEKDPARCYRVVRPWQFRRMNEE